MGRIITLTGVSASGKTTLARGILKNRSDARMVPSYTTREPRESDLPDEYRHIAIAQAGIFNGKEFVWNVWKGGNHYGTRGIDIKLGLDTKGIWIMILVPDKVQLLRDYVRECVGHDEWVKSFFLTTPERAIVAVRMKKRGDQFSSIIERIEEEKNWENDARCSGIPYHFLPDDSEAVVLNRVLMSL